MKIASLAISAVLFATPALAEPLSVDVLAPHAEVDAAEVRAAIAAELGLDVTDTREFAPVLGRLEIAVGQGEVRIAYHPSAGTLIERTLALPIAPEERIQLIAYVATNLVRDQAGEILDGLRPPPAPVVVIPPPVVPPAKPSPPGVRHVPATLGFVPPASIDRAFGERAAVGFGLHVLVGSTDSSRYASISGLVDIQATRAGGAQIGGIAAVSNGDVDGVQIGGVATYARRHVHGAQIGGVVVFAGSVEGVQVGGVGAIARGDVGVQVGGVGTVARGSVHTQIAGVAASARSVEAVQIAGVAAIANRVRGVQIGGVATVGDDVKGVQIGVVNFAHKMRGVQIGVINVSNDGDESVPIGLINYSRNGGLAAQGWVETSQLSAAAIQHGTKYVHNTWAVGWSPDYDDVLVGAGLGVHLPTGDVAFDIDAMYWLTDVWDAQLGQISQLRASLAVPIGRGVELFGGAAANVYVSDGMDESASFHPVYERRTTTDGGNAVVAWPTAFAGLRLRAR